MIGRVATFAMNRQMLDAALQTQARMANMQLQEASGLVSTDYGGLGSDARKLISLEVTAKRSERYEAAAETASRYNEATYSALGSIADLLTDIRTRIAATQSTSSSDSARQELILAAAATLDELASLLNTKHDDKYLFAGVDTFTQPVALDGFTFSLGTTDTGYYQASGTQLSTVVSEDQTITYGITGDNAAFENALRALGVLASSDADGEIDLETIASLLEDSVDGVAQLQGTVSIVASSLERAVARQQDLQAFYAEQISSVRDIDVTAVAAQLTAYETQLQASYAALAKIQSLSLLDYLR